MPDVTAARTLVKSAPELWTECSDASSLSRHLDSFGEIRITRLEPETAVAWEGEHASGTVRLEPAGWGTRVVLTVTPNPAQEDPPPASEPAASVVDGVVGAEPVTLGEPDPDPDPEPEPVAEPEPDAEPELVAEPDPEPEPVVEHLPEPEPVLQLEPPAPKGFFARVRSWFGRPAPGELVAPSAEDEAVTPEQQDAAVTPQPEGEARTPEPAAAAPPGPEAIEPVEPEAIELVPSVPLDPQAALDAALDSLGQAHHRPYSRA